MRKRISEKEDRLPSPNQLRRRILLKGKVPTGSNEEHSSSSSAEESLESDSSLKNVEKTGRMFIQNQSTQWKPYFFALQNSKLSYIEMEKEKLESDNVS